MLSTEICQTNKEYIQYDFINTKSPEKANPQKSDQWLPGAEVQEGRGMIPKGCKVSVWGNEEAMELGSSDGFTTQ